MTTTLPAPQRSYRFNHEASRWVFDYYTNLGYNIIFATIHGSYLYGTAHEHSDVDFYIVVEEGKNLQKKYEDNTDVVKMNLERFLQLVWDGSHQAVEALCSPYTVWNDTHPYMPMLQRLQPSKGNMMRKSLSAARSFRTRAKKKTTNNPEKFMQHSRRLEKAAQDILKGNYTLVYMEY